MQSNKKIFFLFIIFLFFIIHTASCSKKQSPIYKKSINTSISTNVVDCSGYITEMKIMYGLNLISKLEKLGEHGGKVFARILSVDHLDGTMSVAILPPVDGTDFDMDFINELANFDLKFIACTENTTSALGGSKANGSCLANGPINLIGASNSLKEHQFTSSGFRADTGSNWTRVMASRNPGADEGKKLPTFIMLVASHKKHNNNNLSGYIIASADSPYKQCYYKTH